jgi:hypothetical protein
MTTSHLELWVKSMTSWQSRQFGSLSVQEDVNIIDREMLVAQGRLEAEPDALILREASPNPSPDSPIGESLREESDVSSCGESHSDLL